MPNFITMKSGYRNILFLCTANAIRSQMAEGLARNLLPKEVVVYSAGIVPSGVHPMAIEVMKEIGIDISQHRSKSIAEIPADKIDLVITLCGDADRICPAFPTQTVRRHWPTADPYTLRQAGGDPLEAFREVRDQLSIRIKDYFDI